MNTQLLITHTHTHTHIYIYINSVKPVCIKYGDPVMEYEKALLNGVYLSWADNVRHLGN